MKCDDLLKRFIKKLQKENTMTKQGCLDWCKQRALISLESEDSIAVTLAHLILDLGKNESTQRHDAIRLGPKLMFDGELNTKDKMKQFIEDLEKIENIENIADIKSVEDIEKIGKDK